MSTRSPYEIAGGGGGGVTSPYEHVGSVPVGVKPSRKKRHGGGIGGLLHGVEHAAGQTVNDLANAAINTPGGVYALSKANYQDLGDLVEQAVGAKKPGKLFPHLRALGKAQVKATEQDVKHPLRHPGYTLLDALTVASAGAGAVGRVGELGRTGELGALVRGAPFEERTLLTPEGKRVTIGQYSRAYGARATQKALDRLREAHPNIPIAGRRLTRKVGFQLERRRHISEAIRRTPGGALAVHGAKLSAGEDKALQVVAEGVPIEKRLERHRADLEKATKAQDKSRLRKEIAVTKKAARFVENKTGPGGHLKPQFSASAPKRLTNAYDALKRANASSEQMIHEAGLLPSDVTARRVGTAAEQYGGEAGAAEQYIPAGAKKRITGTARMGANKMIGVPNKAGFQREFTGQSISRGMLPRKTKFGGGVAKAVAEHQAEVVRLTSVIRHRAEFEKLAVDAPEDLAHYVPMRLDKGVKLSAGDRELMQRAIDGQLSDANETKATGLLQRLHEQVFPDASAIRAQAEREGLPIKGVKWVREDYLGGLNKPNPLVGFASHRGGREALAATDAINNASKIADLYLKPAYAIPNVLGNAALNVLQQGFAAPKNLARAVRIYHTLSPEAIAAGDAAMDEGIALSIAHNPGALGGTASRLAGGWSKVVDRRFRWSSFLYEAQRAGFKSDADVERLLTDSKLHEKLVTVAQEGNSEVIDYSRLGPAERDVIRRVIFFYPWVKGSSVYAGRMLLEHPGKSAALYGLGRQQKASVDQTLGPLPSWAQGIFPVGKRGHNPLVVNPASTSILGTPAQVAETIAGLNKGNVGAAFTAGTMVTPAMAALLTLATGTNNFGGQLPQGQGRLSGALEQLYGGIPQVTLEQRLTQNQSQKTSPMSRRDALLQYLIGGIAPRPENLAKLHSAAARERSGRR